MLIIETTSDSKKKLKNISHILLKGRLVACTQIIKISNSSYIWNNELESKKDMNLSPWYLR